MLINVFIKDRLDGLGQNGIDHLPLAHLVAAHHVQFQLAQA